MKYLVLFAIVLAVYADFEPGQAVYAAGISSGIAAISFRHAVAPSFGVIFYNLVNSLYPSEDFIFFDILGDAQFGGGPDFNLWIVGVHLLALIAGIAMTTKRGF